MHDNYEVSILTHKQWKVRQPTNSLDGAAAEWYANILASIF